MTERMPFHEAPPDQLEVRRDALLLRVKEMRDKLGESNLNPEVVSAELSALHDRVQQVGGLLDMGLFDEIFDALEKVFDANRR